MEKLKPCPLCGGKASESYYNFLGAVFECPKCRLVLMKNWFPADVLNEEKINIWNSRIGDKEK